MAAETAQVIQEFDWRPQPTAAAYIGELVRDLCQLCPAAANLADRLLQETGTRLLDWIDHLALPSDDDAAERLAALGFINSIQGQWSVWRHPQGLFPTVHTRGAIRPHLAIQVESVADFLVAQGLEHAAIVGEPLARLRKAQFYADERAELWVVERHGCDDYDPHPLTPVQAKAVLAHRETFRRRPRQFEREEDGFKAASDLIRAAKRDLRTDWACDLFFAAEREYWQNRNSAARVQKARQDRLGLGWANHDHHTYRSSRRYFTHLIKVLEDLGFVCRERFYGGHGAGWGAQVLEQPACGIVIFADVDLTPEEVTGDFAHEALPEEKNLGTVGLWCRLHGEAFLQAGMHHLECRFDFDAAREQLRTLGVETMKPFTDFPFLKQAFTQGDNWPVDAGRIERLLADGLVTADQAARFRRDGALGSHLEILERNEGYKGFNQTGISEIIRSTDPRKQ